MSLKHLFLLALPTVFERVERRGSSPDAEAAKSAPLPTGPRNRLLPVGAIRCKAMQAGSLTDS